MLLAEILDQIPGAIPSGGVDVQIRDVVYDSRAVKKGDLFVAVRGQQTDGNRFLQDAVARGAVALASEEPLAPIPGVSLLRIPDARLFLAQASQAVFQHPGSHLRLVGITGTNGKTTTSLLIDAVLRRAALKSCLVGTIGMKIGDEWYRTRHTTPEAPDLLRFLRQAIGEGCTHGALEVSSHALSSRRVYGTRFVVGVFTNLTPEHLDFHGDMESYYQAKRLLFSPEGGNQVELGVINTDDPWGRRLAAETGCPVVCFGLGENAPVRARRFSTRADGIDLQVATPQGELRIATRLIGRPNIYNILAAAAACLGLGIDLEGVRRGMESLETVPGRMEAVDCGQSFTVLIDYAHTPDALQKALETLSEIPHRRIITVFGCGGDRDRTKRPVMGEIAARLSDFVIATSDNPRTEKPETILDEIETGLKTSGTPYRIVVDRREAIADAVRHADAGDVVLVAGKGHEDYQILGEESLPFDDRLVAREILGRMMDLRGSRN